MKAKMTRKNSKAQRKAIARHRLDPQMYLVPLVKDNPRQEGTFGFKSMKVILSARKPISVAAATDEGARLKDIHWDLTHGNLKLQKRA